MKKAQLSVTAKWIIAAMVIIMGILFYTTVFGKTVDMMNREACRLNVQAQALTKGVSTNPVNLLSGKSNVALKSCKTFNIHFKEKEVIVTESGKKKKVEVYVEGTKTKRFDRLTNDIVNQVLAEQMRLCWYQFHEGQLDIFNKQFLSNFGISGDHQCYLCNRISFDQDVRDNRFEDFYEYVNNTNITLVETSYLQYISQPTMSAKSWIETAAEIGIDKNNMDITFTKDQQYFIMFYRFNKGSAEKNKFFTYVIPAEKYYSICKSIVR